MPIQIKYAHKKRHPKKVEIHVDGEVMDNAMEAQEDEWYTVEVVMPVWARGPGGIMMIEQFEYVEKVPGKNIKIFEMNAPSETVEKQEKTDELKPTGV